MAVNTYENADCTGDLIRVGVYLSFLFVFLIVFHKHFLFYFIFNTFEYDIFNIEQDIPKTDVLWDQQATTPKWIAMALTLALTSFAKIVLLLPFPPALPLALVVPLFMCAILPLLLLLPLLHPQPLLDVSLLIVFLSRL